MTNDTRDVGTTGLDYLSWINGQAITDTNCDVQMLLRQLITMPVGIFNDPEFWGGLPKYQRQSQRIFGFTILWSMPLYLCANLKR